MRLPVSADLAVFQAADFEKFRAVFVRVAPRFYNAKLFACVLRVFEWIACLVIGRVRAAIAMRRPVSVRPRFVRPVLAWKLIQRTAVIALVIEPNTSFQID
jgi:hypothetical protein